MSNPALGTLLAGGRPTPPGRSPGPGQPMPAYQGLPAARWDGASRGIPNAPTPPTITSHMGDEANKPVHQQHPVLQWPDGQEKLMRQGQIAFFLRRNPRSDGGSPFAGYVMCATMQHLNSMAQAGWARARRKLQAGHQYLPDGIKISLEEFDALREEDIMDYFGKREVEIPDDWPTLKEACKLLHIKEFKYLLPGPMLMHWNWYGGINNISYGVSPQAKVNQSTARALVVTFNVAKRAVFSNVWGDKSKLVEGAKIGLVCRRRLAADGTPGAPEVVPWAELDLITPPFTSRSYNDEMNRTPHGWYIPIGTCSEIANGEISERHRRDAIGNNSKPAAVVHDAYGTLPQITVQVRL